MIVGEALNRRADLQRRIAQMNERLGASVLVQEDEEPPEAPQELLGEVDELCDQLERLIGAINHTNATSLLSTGETVTEALARRDVLALRRKALRSAVSTATESGLRSFRRSEGRMVRQIKVGDVQARIDRLSREERELDTVLQQHNWTAPLIE